MNIYGKKIFIDTENTVTIYQKLSKIYQDISILESVIGGDNKGRYSIIFFNIYENIKVFINKATINKKKLILSRLINLLGKSTPNKNYP